MEKESAAPAEDEPAAPMDDDEEDELGGFALSPPEAQERSRLLKEKQEAKKEAKNEEQEAKKEAKKPKLKPIKWTQPLEKDLKVAKGNWEDEVLA